MNYEAIAIWSQVVAFVLFAATLVYVWKRAIEPAVIIAQRNSNARIALAEKHRDEMAASVALLHGEVESAERDAQAIRDRAKDLGEHERLAIVAEAHEEAAHALHSAGGELDRQRLAARAQLRAAMLEQALLRAREQSQARVNADVSGKLVADFATSLERGGLN